LAADCGCQESNGDYPSPVFMISTESKFPNPPPLRTAWGPQSLPNPASVKTTLAARGCGKGFEFGLAQNFSHACL